MSKQDYLKAVTAKVFSTAEKKIIKTELETHIDEKADFFKDIGYDEQISEEKAVDTMGETDLLSVQFGELHNNFYNPIFDIILFIIWLGFLGGAYYLLKEYVFCDPGMSSLIIAGSCLSFALMSGVSALSLFRNKLLPIILSFFGICTTGIFNYFTLIELDRKMNSSFSEFINFVTKTTIPISTVHPNEEKVIAIVIALLIIAVVVFLFSLSYNIKIKCLKNKKYDNTLMHLFIKISCFLAVLGLSFCIFFSFKCYFDLNTIKSEYYDAYNYVIALSENCDTKEEIIDFVNSGEYKFTERKDTLGNLSGYYYTRNLVNIDIAFSDVKSKAEIYKKDKKEIDEAIKKLNESAEEHFGNNTALKATIDTYKNEWKKTLDNQAEGEYYEQSFCEIIFRPVISSFNNSYDLTSTSFLEIKNDDEIPFRLPENNNIAHLEKYDFYKKTGIPSKLDITYILSDIDTCEYVFEYIFGEGKYKHTEDFSGFKSNEATKAFYDNINKTIDIIKSDRSMSEKEVAKRTGAALELPEVSKEEYEESLNVLGSFFDSAKGYVLDAYDMKTKYILDDYYFVLQGKPYNQIYLYNKYHHLVHAEFLGDSPNTVNYTDIDGVQKKVCINGLFYDKLGYCYSSPDYVPYYTSDGKKYYYYCQIIKDDTHTVGDTKEYYITDRNNKFYQADNCFIDKNGYLCINTGNIKYDADDKKYKSSNQNEYTKAFETSWNENGKPILQSDKNKTTSSNY
ncbi:MAG: hypothetical protein NC397_00275 [Clostridium sp.]|nr:hypothetical protein [Clostridium sp.]